MKVRAAAGPQFASALRLHSSGLRLSEKKFAWVTYSDLLDTLWRPVALQITLRWWSAALTHTQLVRGSCSILSAICVTCSVSSLIQAAVRCARCYVSTVTEKQSPLVLAAVNTSLQKRLWNRCGTCSYFKTPVVWIDASRPRCSLGTLMKVVTARLSP